jgi:hypothetical protein
MGSPAPAHRWVLQQWPDACSFLLSAIVQSHALHFRILNDNNIKCLHLWYHGWQAEALVQTADVQLAVNLHVREEVRQLRNSMKSELSIYISCSCASYTVH